MPETGDLVRYALKLATGTGKTVVMALIVTWATLHKRKVSGSSLSENFFVLVPNLTVRDRVEGVPRGDGLNRPESTTYTMDSTPCRRSTGRSSVQTCWYAIGSQCRLR